MRTHLICPNCGVRGFGIIKGLKRNTHDVKRQRKAMFGCTNCDHTEVI